MTGRPPDFTYARASGLWDAGELAWVNAVRYVTRYGSVTGFTETTHHVPLRAGWGTYRATTQGANECTIMWKRTVWEQAGPATAIQVSHTPYALGNGKPRPPIHLTVVPLQHRRTGRVVIFAEVHTPSAVEGHRGLLDRYRRAQVYRETLAGITRARRYYRRQYPDAPWIQGGDWNLNLRLPWVRALLAGALPGLRSSWRKLPHRGTFGNGRRVIDDVRHTRDVVTPGATLLQRPEGFDHTPLMAEFRFRP